jgi:hypothetical protein
VAAFSAVIESHGLASSITRRYDNKGNPTDLDLPPLSQRYMERVRRDTRAEESSLPIERNY